MLNLDEFVKSIKTHQITINGKEYTAKPLTLKELAIIQQKYNEADEDSLDAVRALFDAVGYPSDELLELPLEAIIEVQSDLFLSISQRTQKLDKIANKKS